MGQALQRENGQGSQAALLLQPRSMPTCLAPCPTRRTHAEGGSVRVGGEDVRHVQLDSLRRGLGKVPQVGAGALLLLLLLLLLCLFPS